MIVALLALLFSAPAMGQAGAWDKSEVVTAAERRQLNRADRLGRRADAVEEVDPVAAEALFEEQRSLYASVLGDRHRAVADADLYLAFLQSETGRHEEALQSLNRCIAINEDARGPDDPMRRACPMKLAGELMVLGRHDESRAVLERLLAERVAYRGEGHPEVQRLQMRLAETLLVQQDYEAALPQLESVRTALLREGGRDGQLADVLADLASAHLGLGHPAEASRLADEALRLHRLAGRGEQGGLDFALSVAFDVAILRDELPKAWALLDELARLPDRPSYDRARQNLDRAALLLRAGDVDRALALLESTRARIDAEFRGSDLDENWLDVRATAAEAIGDVRTGVEMRRQRLALLEQRDAPEADVVGAIAELASVLVQADPSEAGQLSRRAMQFMETASIPVDDRVNALESLGLVAVRSADNDTAVQWFREALLLAEQYPETVPGLRVSSLEFNLAVSLAARGDVRAGLDHALMAEALDQRHDAREFDVAYATMLIAGLHTALGEPDAAVARLAELDAGLVDVLGNLLGHRSDRGRLAATLAVSWWRDVEQLTWEAADDPAAGRRSAMAWQGRALRLVQVTAERARARASPEVRELTQALSRVRTALALAPAEERSELAAERDRLERVLSQHPTARRTRKAMEPPTDEALCRALPEGGAHVQVALVHPVVDLEVLESRYFAYVQRADDCVVRRVDLGSAHAIERAIDRHTSLLASPTSLTSRVDGAGERLRALVWDPLAAELDAVDHLTVVPDGVMARLAWGALPLGDGTYLLEHVAVSQAEHAGAILPSTRQPGAGAALLAGSDYASYVGVGCAPTSFSDLGLTGPEVAAIAESLGPQAEVLPASTVGLAKALAGRRYVHLAAHGFFAPSCETGHNPLLASGIAFEDAPLTSEELASFDLGSAELVTLSACESGRGHGEEGLLGLRRAMVIAGAEHLVMSLWAVQDEATSELMVAMYAGIVAGLEPGEALRQAQLEQLQRYRTENGDALPGLWGAFIHSRG